MTVFVLYKIKDFLKVSRWYSKDVERAFICFSIRPFWCIVPQPARSRMQPCLQHVKDDWLNGTRGPRHSSGSSRNRDLSCLARQLRVLRLSTQNCQGVFESTISNMPPPAAAGAQAQEEGGMSVRSRKRKAKECADMSPHSQ
jgi:hypothetical protein